MGKENMIALGVGEQKNVNGGSLEYTLLDLIYDMIKSPFTPRM